MRADSTQCAQRHVNSCSVIQQLITNAYHKYYIPLRITITIMYMSVIVLAFLDTDSRHAAFTIQLFDILTTSLSLPLNCICKILNDDVLLSFSYPDIIMYLLYTTSFVTPEEVKNYDSLQSFRFFISGWVLEVEWKKYSEEGIVLIIGKVRHSYAANKTPLRPWVLVPR